MFAVILIIISILLALVVNFFVAREFYKVAVMKGRTEKKYFVIAFLLPIAGYILIAALPDRGSKRDMAAVISDDLPEL